MYFESFENKMNTITSYENPENIFKKIESFVLSLTFCKIVIDICVSVSLENLVVTLATSKIFKAFNICSNYNPFRCKNIKKLKGKTNKRKGITKKISDLQNKLLLNM